MFSVFWETVLSPKWEDRLWNWTNIQPFPNFYSLNTQEAWRKKDEGTESGVGCVHCLIPCTVQCSRRWWWDEQDSSFFGMSQRCCWGLSKCFLCSKYQKKSGTDRGTEKRPRAGSQQGRRVLGKACLVGLWKGLIFGINITAEVTQEQS